MQHVCDKRKLCVMFRFVCPILLIANLLTCPSRCMSCHVAAASVKECVPAGCSCCHCETASTKSESSEGYPGDDCPCPNCICEGATLQDGLELPDANTQPASNGHWTARLQRDISVEIVQGFARVTQDCDCRISGRDARIAHHSWLI